MRIDPKTLSVEWTDPIPQAFDANQKSLPLVGLYYAPFTGGGGGSTVELYERSTVESKLIRYLHLEVRQDEFSPTGARQTRYLTYTPIAEDKIIDPLCNPTLSEPSHNGASLDRKNR